MYVADSLSRLNEIGYSEIDILNCIDVEQYVSGITARQRFIRRNIVY